MTSSRRHSLPSPQAGSPGDDAADATALAADWVTIWQSEMSAIASDREAAEHMQALLGAWFAACAVLRRHDRDDRAPAAGADAAPGAAPAAAAPAAGEDRADVERRLAELERRLAAMVAAGDAGNATEPPADRPGEPGAPPVRP